MYNTSEAGASQLAVARMVKGSHILARNWLNLLPTFRPECYGLLQGKGASLRLKTRAFWLKRWQDFQPIICTIDFNVWLCSIKYGQIL